MYKENPMSDYTIAIIGTGTVGSNIAYTLITEKIPAKILLVDINTKKCIGEKLDLEDACAFMGATNVNLATLQEAAYADIIIITAGIAQKPEQTRKDLLASNSVIIQSLIDTMGPIKKTSIIIMVTNPVDILTLQIQEMGLLPRNQIFGSSTFLDTLRLKNAIAEKYDVNLNAVDTMVIGEHGDNQFALWSKTRINRISIKNISFFTPQILDALEESAKKKAYSIIDAKGSTAFGVATCVSTYCKAILKNTPIILPVSCYQQDATICMSMPIILGKTGIQKQVPLLLDEQEKYKLSLCVKSMQKNITTMRAKSS